MWQFLEQIPVFLQNLRDIFASLPEDNCKALFDTRQRTFTSSQPKTNLKLNSSAIPLYSGLDGQLQPFMIEYLTEGIMPLLSTYLKFFFEPESEDEIRVSIEIAEALLVSIYIYIIIYIII